MKLLRREGKGQVVQVGLLVCTLCNSDAAVTGHYRPVTHPDALSRAFYADSS